MRRRTSVLGVLVAAGVVAVVVLMGVSAARYLEYRRTGGIPQVTDAEWHSVVDRSDALFGYLQDTVGHPIDEVIAELPAIRWDGRGAAPDLRDGGIVLTRERTTATFTRWSMTRVGSMDTRVYTCDGLEVEHDPTVRQPTVQTGWDYLERACDPDVVALLDGYRYVQPVAFSG